jgi:predicted nucleic acid-binding protein
MNKIYFDINVIISLLDSKRENHFNAKKLLKKVIDNNFQVVISEDMLSTIFYIVKDKKSVLNFFKVIEQKWIISGFGNDVINEAIKVSLTNNLDFEDVVQCLCAKQNGCSFLITDDNRFFDCGIKIYNIEEFLDV